MRLTRRRTVGWLRTASCTCRHQHQLDRSSCTLATISRTLTSTHLSTTQSISASLSFPRRWQYSAAAAFLPKPPVGRPLFYPTPRPPPRPPPPQYTHIPEFCVPVYEPLPPGQKYYYTLPVYPRLDTGKYIAANLREKRNHIPIAVMHRRTATGKSFLLSVERLPAEALIRKWQEPVLFTRVGVLDVQEDMEGRQLFGLRTPSTPTPFPLSPKQYPVMLIGVQRHSVTEEIQSMSFVFWDPSEELARTLPESSLSSSSSSSSAPAVKSAAPVKQHKVTYSLPLLYVNDEDCLGVRKEGVLIYIKYAVPVRFTGTDHTKMPSKLKVDMMNVDIGSIIRHTDLIVPADVEVLHLYKVNVMAVIQGVSKGYMAEAGEEGGVTPATAATTTSAATPAAGTDKTTTAKATAKPAAGASPAGATADAAKKGTADKATPKK